MSKARDLANLASVGSVTGRNVIVNSAMMVSQRGTSFASVGNVYTLDRFQMYKQNSGAAFTVTQSSVTDLAGFANALKVDCTTADTSLASNEQAYVSYFAEGQDLQRFQKGYATALGFTLSFYVKTNKTGLYTVSMFDRDNTRKVNGSYTVADTNWNRYTINFPADTTGKFDDNNESSLEIFFNLYAGADTNTGTLSTTWAASADAGSTTGQVNFADSTSNDWEITGVQLEVGETATDFEHRSYQDELTRCQRYFTTWESGWAGVSGGTSYNQSSQVSFPVHMRGTPTIARTGGTSTTRYPSSNFLSIKINTTSFTSLITAASAGGNESWQAIGTADAEL
tara:strand:- start:265 stop:1284 length:1020 start_codon:yes stop_codon:yes gene_type:complete